jgi:hypothetical protein
MTVALLACQRHKAPAPQSVVLGPPAQIDYCTPEIDRRMTDCVPTCGRCEYKGGGHICHFAAGEDQKPVFACIDECRKKAESICLRSR